MKKVLIASLFILVCSGCASTLKSLNQFSNNTRGCTVNLGGRKKVRFDSMVKCNKYVSDLKLAKELAESKRVEEKRVAGEKYRLKRKKEKEDFNKERLKEHKIMEEKSRLRRISRLNVLANMATVKKIRPTKSDSPDRKSHIYSQSRLLDFYNRNCYRYINNFYTKEGFQASLVDWSISEGGDVTSVSTTTFLSKGTIRHELSCNFYRGKVRIVLDGDLQRENTEGEIRYLSEVHWN